MEPEPSSRPPSLPSHLYPLWPLPPDLRAPQSLRLVVPAGSIFVEPHAEVPFETIPPAELPAPPNRCPPASLGFLPPVGPAPRHPSEECSTPPLHHQSNPQSPTSNPRPRSGPHSTYITLSILLLSPVRTPNRSVSF